MTATGNSLLITSAIVYTFCFQHHHHLPDASCIPARCHHHLTNITPKASPVLCCPAGSHGGEHVQVEGSFDNWTSRQQLQRSGREFTVIKLLPPGVYQVRDSSDTNMFGCLHCLAETYMHHIYAPSAKVNDLGRLSTYILVLVPLCLTLHLC